MLTRGCVTIASTASSVYSGATFMSAVNQRILWKSRRRTSMLRRRICVKRGWLNTTAAISAGSMPVTTKPRDRRAWLAPPGGTANFGDPRPVWNGQLRPSQPLFHLQPRPRHRIRRQFQRHHPAGVSRRDQFRPMETDPPLIGGEYDAVENQVTSPGSRRGIVCVSG